MQANAWIGLIKTANGCPQDPDINIDGTENPSLIARGGFLADGTFAELAGGIG